MRRFDDLEAVLDPGFLMDRKFQEAGMRSGLMVPLVRCEAQSGYVAAVSRTPHAFTDEHELALQAISDSKVTGSIARTPPGLTPSAIQAFGSPSRTATSTVAVPVSGLPAEVTTSIAGCSAMRRSARASASFRNASISPTPMNEPPASFWREASLSRGFGECGGG